MKQTLIHGARCFMLKYVKIHIFSHFTWLSQKKTVGDGEKLLTYLNSALKALLGFDIFSRVPKKKVKFCCLVKYVKIQFFSHFTWLSQKNRGWWRKTTYIFEFSVKSCIRIWNFPSCAKKKVKFCCLVLYFWISAVHTRRRFITHSYSHMKSVPMVLNLR